MKAIEVTTKISWETYIDLANRFIEKLEEAEIGSVSVAQAETLEQLAAQVRNKTSGIPKSQHLIPNYKNTTSNQI